MRRKNYTETGGNCPLKYDSEACYHFAEQNRIGEYGELLMVNNYPDSGVTTYWIAGN